MRKKIIKISIVLCLTGICMAAAGFAAGGKKYVQNANLNTLSGSASYEENSVLEETLDLENIRSIEADLAYTDLNILPSQDESCHLSFRLHGDSSQVPPSCQVENRTLYLKSENKCNSFINIDISFLNSLLRGEGLQPPGNSSEITLYLPANLTLEECRLNIQDGDMDARGLKCKSPSIRLSYGDLTGEDCQFLDGTIQTSDGDLDLRDSSVSGTDLSMSYGNCRITDSLLEDSFLDLSDGSLTVKNVILSKEVTAQIQYGNASFHLSEETPALSLLLDTSYGSIQVDQRYGGTQTSYKDGDTTHYETTVPDAKDILTVHSSDGDITVS